MTPPRFATLLFLLLCVATRVAAQGGHGRQNAAMDYKTEMRLMLGAGANPANMTSLSDSSRTSFAVGYDARGNTVERREEGRSWRGWNVEGRTYLSIAPNLAAKCEVSYTNGVRKKVSLAENADYDIIAPMAVADTSGGDKDAETYAFGAGFGCDGRRASVGLAISYSSRSEYRDVDPRPKADAVEANVRVGGLLRLSDTHAVGLYGALRKYSQDLTVKFLNAYNAAMAIYHLQGIGTDYTRFSGVYDETKYRGRGFALGAEYLGPLSAKAEFRHMTVEKSLADLENAVIGETERETLDVSLGRRLQMGGAWRAVAAVNAVGSKTRLSQHIYDDGTHNYHLISTRYPYEARTFDASAAFAALTEWLSGKGGVYVHGQIGVAKSEEKNLDNHDKLKLATLGIRLGGEVWRDWRKCRLTAGVTAGSRIGLSDEAALSAVRATELPGAKAAIADDHARRSATRTGGEASLRLDIDLPRNIRTIYVIARGESAWYGTGGYPQVGAISIAAGLTL